MADDGYNTATESFQTNRLHRVFLSCYFHYSELLLQKLIGDAKIFTKAVKHVFIGISAVMYRISCVFMEAKIIPDQAPRLKPAFSNLCERIISGMLITPSPSVLVSTKSGCKVKVAKHTNFFLQYT